PLEADRWVKSSESRSSPSPCSSNNWLWEDECMPWFAWVPFNDPGWVAYCNSPNKRILPFADGVPVPGHERVSWNQIQANDTLLLAAHGKSFTTDKVAWVRKDAKGKKQIIAQWTVQQFAQAIHHNLGDSHDLFLYYRLLACFGANNITPLAQSFG